MTQFRSRLLIAYGQLHALLDVRDPRENSETREAVLSTLGMLENTIAEVRRELESG